VVEVFAGRLNRHSPTDEQDAGFSTDPAYGSPNASNNPPLRDDYEIPGWAVTNVRTGFNVWQRDLRSFDLTVDFNNIFNTRYREAYSQQQKVAPGFGIVVGARLTF
jgi:outer membrane receptor protein involved in Fe transport